jgi:hypothetical protein
MRLDLLFQVLLECKHCQASSYDSRRYAVEVEQYETACRASVMQLLQDKTTR